MENKKRRILAIGDIHGSAKGLLQCLERANVTTDDVIIQLGDVVDGWSETFKCVETLLELQKTNECYFIRGNHDHWFNNFINTGRHPANWTQGSKETGLSYLKYHNPKLPWYTFNDEPGTGVSMNLTLKTDMIPESHIKFFNNQIPYHIIDNNLFVHGGFNRHFSIDDPVYNNEDILMWDRDLWMQALSYRAMSELKKPIHDKPDSVINHIPKFKIADDFNEIFIGHTTTQMWNETIPMNAANLWNLDTGAGFSGKLTIMDINTKEFWQSDYSKELYPKEKGR